MKEKPTELTPNLLLIKERKRRKWTQREVAAKAEVTIATYNRWERGVTRPSPYFRQKLCQIFMLSEQQLGFAEDLVEEELPAVKQNLGLPMERPGLIGRSRQLAALLELVRGRQRSVALTGLPGVGKTALALALAHHEQIQTYFPDGIMWIRLGQKPQIVAQMRQQIEDLHIDFSAREDAVTIDALALRLRRYMQKRRMLVFIDDVWDLAHGISFRLGGSQCVHLITTRIAGIAHAFAGEQTIHVQAFDLEASMELLKTLTPEAVRSYPEECTRLAQGVGGLPIALGLIGRYLHIETLSGSAHRLQRAVQRLLKEKEQRMALSEPHEPWKHSADLPLGMPVSLQAAIQMSDKALDSEGQQALRALALMPDQPDSFSEQAALAVTEGQIEQIDMLVDYGLLHYQQENRLSMHQTIADYARLQGTSREAKKRLVRYGVAYLREHQQEEYGMLKQELALLLKALELANEEECWQEFLEGSEAFAEFLEHEALLAVAQSVYPIAVQAALRLHEYKRAIQCYLYWGRVAEKYTDYTQAGTIYIEGLQLAEQQGNEELVAVLLVGLGRVMDEQGRFQEAWNYLQRGLVMLRRSQDTAQLGFLLKQLGELSEQFGEGGKAIGYYREALDVVREKHVPRLASMLCQNIGVYEARRGDYATADQYYQEGLAIAQDEEDEERQSALLMNMGMLAYHREDCQTAIEYSQASLTIARRIQHRKRMSAVLQNLGIFERACTHYEQAETYLCESLSIAREMSHHWLIYETQGELGQLYIAQQRLVEAEQVFLEMLSATQALGAPLLQAVALFGLAQVAESKGAQERAMEMAIEAHELFARAEDFHGLVLIRQWLARYRRG